jgi:flavin-dependent dehydrogenase
MLDTIYDLAVLGGGPAGLATSIIAAQRGLSVAVIEKRPPPFDKACGEGIMPHGTRMLRKMGVTFGKSETVPFKGIRYIDGDIVAEGRFASEPGWGIRRTILVRRMVERAKDLGVTLLQEVSARGWTVEANQQVTTDTDRGPIKSRFLVGADGLHSKARRQAGLERTTRGLRRYGARRHYEVEPWSTFVEVYWSRGIEAYVTPVAAKKVGVALIWSGKGAGYESSLERFPRLEERLSGAAPASRTRGAGPFRQSVKRRYRGPVALVGDAAGYLDAMTGEGLSLSFLSANALVEAIQEGRGLRDYERNYRKLSRNYYWMTRLLLEAAKRPRLRSRIIECLALDPSLFDSFLAISTGEKSIVSEGTRSFIGLLISVMKGFRRS